jgi:hypothetical protein
VRHVNSAGCMRASRKERQTVRESQQHSDPRPCAPRRCCSSSATGSRWTPSARRSGRGPGGRRPEACYCLTRSRATPYFDWCLADQGRGAASHGRARRGLSCVPQDFGRRIAAERPHRYRFSRTAARTVDGGLFSELRQGVLEVGTLRGIADTGLASAVAVARLWGRAVVQSGGRKPPSLVPAA